MFVISYLFEHNHPIFTNLQIARYVELKIPREAKTQTCTFKILLLHLHSLTRFRRTENLQLPGGIPPML